MRATTGGNTSVNNNSDDHQQDLNQHHTTTLASPSWGTWEELLLACAVKRHGVDDWDSVSMELQAKTSLPPLLTTPSNCHLKYHDLRRRFNSPRQNHDNDVPPPPPPDPHHDGDPSSNNNNNSNSNIPWLDDLRKLRVAQLRQELHHYDVSIVSLQLKVKRLEEERQDDEPKPDLDDHNSNSNSQPPNGSENDKILQHEPDPSKPDHENQSVNGSNSTCSKYLDHDNKPGPEDRALSEPDRLPAGSAEPSKGIGGGQSESESDKGSSETVAKERSKPVREGKDGATAAGEMRDGSEAQSSASLTRRWNTKRRRRTEVQEKQQQQRNNEESLLEKSQPLVGVLQMIRGHDHSSLFERRLPTQESDEYKSMVQQHVDLGTIQTKLHNDTYSSCALSFYRDLLLLFNNAVVFFPKSSLESRTAHQLRRLVLNEMKKNNLVTRPDVNDPSSGPSDSLPLKPAPTTSQQSKRLDRLERSDSLLAKHKSTAPIIVCRKRSSISSKPSAVSSFGQTQKGEQKQQQGEEKKRAAAFDIKPLALNSNKAASSKDDAEEEHGGSVGLKSAAAKAKDSPVTTGTRSSRRTNSTHNHESINNNNSGSASAKKQNASPASLKAETPKADKKAKTEAVALDKKRSAAADFLKRIKRNSPADTLKSAGGTSTRSGGEQKRRGGGGGKVERVKERVSRKTGDKNKQAKEESSSPSKRTVGRPSKKAAAEAANVVVSTKRPRENGGKQEASRRPRKRSRR